MNRSKFYSTYIKSLLDIFVAGILILILLPVFIIIYFILLMTFKGNPLYFQIRPGINGKLFKLCKFKTMTDAKDVNGKLLEDKDRLTVPGKYLRKTSLDELPQLFNILKGNMSFIGPRPLLPQYLPLYSSFQNRRHEIKPGISGWAQVNGRNAISWENKFEYDVWYVDNVSFSLDLKILLLTIVKVLKSEDIQSKDHATMPEFRGSI